jgi:hypothetical protein
MMMMMLMMTRSNHQPTSRLGGACLDTGVSDAAGVSRSGVSDALGVLCSDSR